MGIVRTNPRILATLLKDQTLSLAHGATNITWASDDYASLSTAIDATNGAHNHFLYHSQILPEDISGTNSDVIIPRAFKHIQLQTTRSKEMAEVFTPAWLCNAQNNLVDAKWFGRREVFNTEITDDDNSPQWEPTTEHVEFPEGRDWRAYVRSKRLEMACGEAPYIASRYDATTGIDIPLHKRIGIIDRKFRIIDENIGSEPTPRNRRRWLRYAYVALQSVYGFDYQGDNVFLSRETLLHTFCEYYTAKWQRKPHLDTLLKVAEIISWNIWQMDGTDFTVPGTKHEALVMQWHGTDPLRGEKTSFKDLIK